MLPACYQNEQVDEDPLERQPEGRFRLPLRILWKDWTDEKAIKIVTTCKNNQSLASGHDSSVFPSVDTSDFGPVSQVRAVAASPKAAG